MLTQVQTHATSNIAPLPSWRVDPGRPRGRFEGDEHGSPVSFFVVCASPGDGPALHRHPYCETFVVQGGRGRFRLGDETLDATAGDVVIVPADTAHCFRALGPDPLQMVAIHDSPRMDTIWL